MKIYCNRTLKKLEDFVGKNLWVKCRCYANAGNFEGTFYVKFAGIDNDGNYLGNVISSCYIDELRDLFDYGLDESGREDIIFYATKEPVRLYPDIRLCNPLDTLPHHELMEMLTE